MEKELVLKKIEEKEKELKDLLELISILNSECKIIKDRSVVSFFKKSVMEKIKLRNRLKNDISNMYFDLQMRGIKC